MHDGHGGVVCGDFSDHVRGDAFVFTACYYSGDDSTRVQVDEDVGGKRDPFQIRVQPGNIPAHDGGRGGGFQGGFVPFHALAWTWTGGGPALFHQPSGSPGDAVPGA